MNSAEAQRKINVPILAFLGILWGFAIFQLQITWTMNPQYSHGWFIPLLCLFILWNRNNSAPLENGRRGSFIQLITGSACLIALLPLWLIRESNPDWRLLNWGIMGVVSLLTISIYYNHGGWAAIKRILFALFFFCTAIPWPLAWDSNLTLFLQGKVSAFVAEQLLFLGYPANLQGSVIILPSGLSIGVDEACSGIRGFQTSLVVAIFLGYYYQLSLIRHILFCVGGVIVAFIMNLIRALALSWLSAKEGADMISKWHDPAGFTVLGGIFVALLISVQFIKKKGIEEPEGSWENFTLNVGTRFPIFGTIWLCTILACTHFWFTYHEKSILDNLPITVNFKANAEDRFEELPISDSVKAQLHYSEANSATWINTAGHSIQGFYARWEPSQASPSILSIHTPDQCLGARGIQLVKKHEDEIIPFEGLNVPFESYTFTSQNQFLYVFRCLWPDKLTEDKVFPGFPKSGYDLNGRISAALRGERNTGNQMIVFAIKGTSDYNQSTQTLREQFYEKVQKLQSN